MEEKSISARIQKPVPRKGLAFNDRSSPPPEQPQRYSPKDGQFNQPAPSVSDPVLSGVRLLVIFVGVIACVLFPPLLIIMIPALVVAFWKK